MAIIHYTGYCPVCKKYQTKEKTCTKCGGALRRCSKWLETYRVIENNKITQKKSKMFDTKREVEEVSATRKLFIQTDAPASITFEQLTTAFLDKIDKTAKDSSYVAFESRIKKLGVFNGKKLTEINADDLIKFKTSISEYSDSYKHTLWRMAGMLFNFADREYAINAPLKLYRQEKAYKPPKVKKGFWDLSQWKIFINKVKQCRDEAKTKREYDEHYRFFILFNVLYYDGNRKGEATALRVKHLNFEEAICSVNDNISHKLKKKDRENGLTYKITTPKNGNKREVKIPSVLINLLKEYISYFDLKDDDFLFFKNNPIPPQTLRERFDYYIELAKVKRITPHQLRNSIASLFFSTGNNDIAAAYAVANRLGHSVKFALDTYGNLFSDEEDKLLEKISNG